jgi:hypothetical protein
LCDRELITSKRSNILMESLMENCFWRMSTLLFQLLVFELYLILFSLWWNIVWSCIKNVAFFFSFAFFNLAFTFGDQSYSNHLGPLYQNLSSQPIITVKTKQNNWHVLHFLLFYNASSWFHFFSPKHNKVLLYNEVLVSNSLYRRV